MEKASTVWAETIISSSCQNRASALKGPSPGRVTRECAVKAAQAGATILPACPGFYAQPKTIDDLLGFVTQRILDLLGIEVARAPRWKEG